MPFGKNCGCCCGGLGLNGKLLLGICAGAAGAKGLASGSTPISGGGGAGNPGGTGTLLGFGPKSPGFVGKGGFRIGPTGSGVPTGPGGLAGGNSGGPNIGSALGSETGSGFIGGLET